MDAEGACGCGWVEPRAQGAAAPRGETAMAPVERLAVAAIVTMEGEGRLRRVGEGDGLRRRDAAPEGEDEAAVGMRLPGAAGGATSVAEVPVPCTMPEGRVRDAGDALVSRGFSREGAEVVGAAATAAAKAVEAASTTE